MRAPLCTLLVMLLSPVALFSQTPKPAAAKTATPAPTPAGSPAASNGAQPTPSTPPAAPQGGAGPTTPTAPGAPDTAEPEPPAPIEAYTYQPDGRRDPFLSLLGQGPDTKNASAHRGEGSAGFTLAEISVRGVLQNRGALIAMVLGPDNKTYVIHSGDKLADGVVKAVTPQGLVVIQDINDPLSIQKQREVRKLLRSLEDANK